MSMYTSRSSSALLRSPLYAVSIVQLKKIVFLSITFNWQSEQGGKLGNTTNHAGMCVSVQLLTDLSCNIAEDSFRLSEDFTVDFQKW